MDKLITGVIIVAVVAFFYWLYTTGGDMGMSPAEPAATASQPAASDAASTGAWIAVVGMGEGVQIAGHYDSYAECYQAIGARHDLSVTTYSCTRH